MYRVKQCSRVSENVLLNLIKTFNKFNYVPVKNKLVHSVMLHRYTLIRRIIHLERRFVLI